MILFTGFYQPGFRTVPVRGWVTLLEAEMDETQTMCVHHRRLLWSVMSCDPYCHI